MRLRFRSIWVGSILTALMTVVGIAVLVDRRDPDVPVYRLRGACHAVECFNRPCGNAGSKWFTLDKRIDARYHGALRQVYETIADLRGEPPIDLFRLREYKGRW